MTDDLIIAFWARILRRDDGHWIWRGAKTSRNYGKFLHKSKMIQATRLSYAIKHNKTIEQIEHLRIIKVCPVRECVNPNHLLALPKTESESE